jgi:hypothetical protein
MEFTLKQATGLAKCKICGKKIERTKVQITAYSYKDQGSIHSDPRDCNTQRQRDILEDVRKEDKYETRGVL